MIFPSLMLEELEEVSFVPPTMHMIMAIVDGR